MSAATLITTRDVHPVGMVALTQLRASVRKATAPRPVVGSSLPVQGTTSHALEKMARHIAIQRPAEEMPLSTIQDRPLSLPTATSRSPSTCSSSRRRISSAFRHVHSTRLRAQSPSSPACAGFAAPMPCGVGAAPLFNSRSFAIFLGPRQVIR